MPIQQKADGWGWPGSLREVVRAPAAFDVVFRSVKRLVTSRDADNATCRQRFRLRTYEHNNQGVEL